MHGPLAGEANVEIADLDQIAHADVGTLVWKSVTRWNAAPIRSSMASSNERPISCMPTGRPASDTGRPAKPAPALISLAEGLVMRLLLLVSVARGCDRSPGSPCSMPPDGRLHRARSVLA